MIVIFITFSLLMSSRRVRDESPEIICQLFKLDQPDNWKFWFCRTIESRITRLNEPCVTVSVNRLRFRVRQNLAIGKEWKWRGRGKGGKGGKTYSPLFAFHEFKNWLKPSFVQMTNGIKTVSEILSYLVSISDGIYLIVQ